MMSTSHPADYEKKDIPFSTVGWFLLSIAIGAVLVYIASAFMIHLYRPSLIHPGESPALTDLARQPPEPRLEVNPAADLEALRKAEDDLLNHYGWVDRSAGVAHIPIDEAMDLALERGYPTRKQGGQK